MSSVTGNTTESFGVIKYVCNTPYIMLMAQLEGKPWQPRYHSTIQTDKDSQGRCSARTFALICVFVKNCLCGYNFPIPTEKNKTKKDRLLYFNNMH